jgi:hypothetical protein
MNFNEQDIAAIQSLGYTPDEARFLYLVATHSGYFVPRQFLSFTGATWGRRANTFTTKLESRGHVTWREYDRTGGVYHLFSKTLYRRIGKENLHNQRRHSVEFIRTRLVLLDFILANLGYDYLETEQDKVVFFCETLGLPKQALPTKTYEGGPRSEPTLRYFVDKFPLFLDRTDPSAAAVAFSYVDPGHASLAGFANHLHVYLPLLRQLETFSFLYIANSPVHFVPADQCFSMLVRTPLEADISSEIVRYFRLRNAWDLKKYESLSANDIEWLKEATRRFHGEPFEHSYLAWASGTLTEQSLRAELEQLRPHRNVHFRTCLVPPRVLEKEIRLSETVRMAIVKKPPESVNRSLSLEKPVSELLDDYCRFVDCSPDYVANFALKKTLSRDAGYKKWKSSRNGPAAAAVDIAGGKTS